LKIAISAMGNSLDAEVNQRFGRTRWLIIFETENGEYEAIDNSDNYNAPQGAGIKTADTVAKKGCKAVITGHLGPKAFTVLNRAGIKGYNCQSGTVQEAIEKYKNGQLTEISSPDVKGHW
jgi:predicted Fe-Mo cluster-binding NifX family protein